MTLSNTIQMDEKEEWAPPDPPSVARNPFWQLDEFLQQQPRKQCCSDQLLMVSEFLYGSTLVASAVNLIDSASNLMIQVVAPSGRRVFLVRASTCSTSNDEETYYVCLLRDSRSGGPYCSCRAYLETTLKPAQQGNNLTAQSASYISGGYLPVCKHLLALKLLPFLTEEDNLKANAVQNHECRNYPEIKPVSEDEFASMILNQVNMF
jgi:hypothetical protein